MKATQLENPVMDELCACKKGFQTASGVFAQAMLAQGLFAAVAVVVVAMAL